MVEGRVAGYGLVDLACQSSGPAVPDVLDHAGKGSRAGLLDQRERASLVQVLSEESSFGALAWLGKRGSTRSLHLCRGGCDVDLCLEFSFCASYRVGLT